MAALSDLEEVLTQRLGDLAALSLRAVLKDLANHKVSKAVAAELRRAAQDLADNLRGLARGPGTAVAMVDQAEHGAAAEAVRGGLEAEAFELDRHEGNQVRGHDIQDLLDDIVGVAVGQRVADVALNRRQ